MSLGASPPDPELTRLVQENAELKQQLARYQRSQKQTKSILRVGGRFLLPLFDRRKVVEHSLTLFDDVSKFAGPKDSWPDRDSLLKDGRNLLDAIVRFWVRRRLVMFLFSFLALGLPLAQLWLVFQQNEIIENQNKYFNIQVYDIVARSLTGDTTAKQITSALLAREDFELLNGIIVAVFSQDSGGSFTEQGLTGGRPLLMKESSARGHLVSALVQAIDRHENRQSVDSLWSKVQGTAQLVLNDATSRLPSLLRIPRQTFVKDAAAAEDVHRYVFNLSTILRRVYAMSEAMGEQALFHKMAAPLVARISQFPVATAEASPISSVLSAAFHELLLDIALEASFGDEPPSLDEQKKSQTALVKEGFNKLKQGMSFEKRIRWGNLKSLLEIQ